MTEILPTRPAFMAHLVAAFPDWETSLRVGEAMIDGGAGLLEVQFPFSDPTADGPYIQRACADALDTGFTVDDGFRLTERLSNRVQAPQVFVMVYANLAFRPGIESFLARCRDAGACGVIIPDLPPDYDEGLYAAGRNLGLEVVPVVPPVVVLVLVPALVVAHLPPIAERITERPRRRPRLVILRARAGA